MASVATEHLAIQPPWDQSAALSGAASGRCSSPTHPWGCHRRRIADRVVFDQVIAALVHGCSYDAIATPGCSDRTTRRRLREWAALASAGAAAHLGPPPTTASSAWT